MVLLRKSSLAALLLAGVAGQALAADLPEPVIVEPPPVADYTPAPAPAFGGWYIRGDVDYHWNDFQGADYYTYQYEYDEHDKLKSVKGNRNGKLDGDLDDGWSIGGGVGYQITDYLRTDVTADYYADADFDGHTEGFCGADGHPCKSDDHTELSTWLLLANAYADFYTYNGFTLYAGAGIGGAHVKWDKLKNTIENETTEHDGNSDWRFAYALTAGASYCLTSNLDLDVGYRYAHVEGGEMFGFKNGGGPGYDDGFNIHEARAGLRYNFGDRSYREGCGAPPPAYEPPPPPEPVYK